MPGTPPLADTQVVPLWDAWTISPSSFLYKGAEVLLWVGTHSGLGVDNTLRYQGGDPHPDHSVANQSSNCWRSQSNDAIRTTWPDPWCNTQPTKLQLLRSMTLLQNPIYRTHYRRQGLWWKLTLTKRSSNIRHTVTGWLALSSHPLIQYSCSTSTGFPRAPDYTSSGKHANWIDILPGPLQNPYMSEKLVYCSTTRPSGICIVPLQSEVRISTWPSFPICYSIHFQGG